MNRRCFLFGAAGLAAGLVEAQDRRGLRAGAAVVEITPSLTRPVYLAGFGQNRRATGVHDPLYARALVLEAGGERLAIVALDLIGLFHQHVQAIRKRIHALPGERVIIVCTHVHSGPDTLGLWGPNEWETGVDPHYLRLLQDRIVAAVEKAARRLRPVGLQVGSRPIPEGVAYNAREPIQDPDVTALRFIDRRARTVATLVHFGCHPEVMSDSGTLITADYCGPALKRVEKRLGGVGLFINGALGGMVTPQISGSTWAEVTRVGEMVGNTAVAALEGRPTVDVAGLGFASRQVRIPLENENLRALAVAGVIVGPPQNDEMVTEVCRLDLGPVRAITLPGEVLPKPALELKRAIGADVSLVVALGNDELGYILDPADYSRTLYRHERRMSVGPQAWPRLRAAAGELLASRMNECK
ncbi:MAG: neutral/alkaline non-lysosomal ceramidase N-terminal domain-containing protein [Armatimonadetes bacterium]|nr:neutral/alkaline non-lysosomal ceramidase N-terminal domain-containing protein [Armatimonadota bacterium]